MGGVTFPAGLTSGNDLSRLIPGYSWYWANPSYQMGTYGIGTGYLAFWLYCSNGLVIHSWALSPSSEGDFGSPAWATVWHPNGLHEVVAVDADSNASDPWWSPYSGKKYFNKFNFNLSMRNASFYIEQSVRES
ncbi:hypothetical protein BKA67DRAFT_330691 [Truncatella angustata]|uniref:Uncharacterized protein n=1 Tax=Truncatella angustata TaxID=152316 RepID=A0A9P8UFV7_9PEZI|nr:uncharacterized protein BKA67DRAFT_330691 [Truncatella angustata]KAH6651502.1 hypothetical protein BKA67DRAFT_330691 [Truncatella angustata]